MKVSEATRPERARASFSTRASVSYRRTGVLLASSLSGTISVLILVVGMHVNKRAAEFELRDVANVLEAVMGQADCSIRSILTACHSACC